MRKPLLACLALSLTGCAGLVAPFVNNPYAGNYSGTFVDSDGRAGPASLNLTNIGNVFGKLTDTKTNTAGNLSGSVDTHLVFNGSVTFPSFTQNVSGAFASTKTATTGTLKGSGGYSITFQLGPKS